MRLKVILSNISRQFISAGRSVANPFVGQILQFAGNFAPLNYLACAGQSLPISQYDALFNLIGTTYGGDGVNVFNLPDLRGRVPLHFGTSHVSGTAYAIGQTGGTNTVTLTSDQLPSHIHSMAAVSGLSGATPNPGPQTYIADEGSGPTTTFAYVPSTQTNLTSMAPGSIAATGQSLPHDNVQPVLAIAYCIAVYGVYPTQS